MALRARLAAPAPPSRSIWPYHTAKIGSIAAHILFADDRRMEAETYLSSGYGIRIAIESKHNGWAKLHQLARTWQPNRLRGIRVSPQFGTPFLAATQVYDIRPFPRKWLSLDKTENVNKRVVHSGMILVTCSGSVGRPTLANAAHKNTLISHDLLRVEPLDHKDWGWLYAYFLA